MVKLAGIGFGDDDAGTFEEYVERSVEGPERDRRANDAVVRERRPEQVSPAGDRCFSDLLGADEPKQRASRVAPLTRVATSEQIRKGIRTQAGGEVVLLGPARA